MVNPEQFFISAVLRSKSTAAALGSGLEPEMFAHYGMEWRWLTAYVTKYRRVPPVPSFSSQFPDFVLAPVDDVEHQADLVRGAYADRRIKEQLTEVGQLVRDGRLDECLTQMQKAVVSTASILGTVPDSDSLRDHSDVKRDIEELHDRIVDTGYAGIPTGFKTWDAHTGGCKPGESVIVGARLGSGKSWTLIQMASAAVMSGYTALYDSLEMTRTNVVLRMQTMLSAATGRPYAAADLMSGTNVPDLEGYQEVLAHLESAVPGKFHVADTTRGNINLTTIAAQIERIQPDIVFIDYLTLLEQSGEWQNVAALSNQVKQLATRYKVPIVSAAQLNREAGITRGMPGVEALSRSDSIGQDADQVMLQVLRSRRVLQHKLSKNRNGASGFGWFSEFRPGDGCIEEINKERAYELIDEDGEDAES